MSRVRFFLLVASACVALGVAGCGEKKATSAQGHDEKEAEGHAHGEAASEAGASFKEGQGLSLAPATRDAIGVKTAEVEERKLARAFTVTATVFDAGPPARALTLVPPELADELERLQPSEAKVLSVRRDISTALTQIEVVLALPGAPKVGTTREVAFRGAERTIAAVPRSALLRSATGTFVYVVNGTRFLRTAVKTGASDDNFIEITDGLYTGDVVVVSAVEELWLTELRITKGGGHSH